MVKKPEVVRHAETEIRQGFKRKGSEVGVLVRRSCATVGF